jgi:hypothetical protein
MVESIGAMLPQQYRSRDKIASEPRGWAWMAQVVEPEDPVGT